MDIPCTTGSLESCIRGNDVNRIALAYGASRPASQVDKQAKTNVGVSGTRCQAQEALNVDGVRVGHRRPWAG